MSTKNYRGERSSRYGICFNPNRARMKFSDGERVLCYEPDPKKVKVIYDAKVLQATSSTDNKGKRVDEYLVHFQVM
jgi:hypothetical protein